VCWLKEFCVLAATVSFQTKLMKQLEGEISLLWTMAQSFGKNEYFAYN
jgi:hypothetical protein